MRFILPIILIAIAVVGFLALVAPTLQEVKMLRADVASYDEALNNSKALENERDRLTKEYNSFKSEDLRRLEVLLPNSINNIRLILEIEEEVALPFGMILQDVQYDTVREENPEDAGVVQAGTAGAIAASKDYGTWELEFSTEGSYADFLDFLSRLEGNLRLIDISSIQFSSGSGNDPSTGITPASDQEYQYRFTIQTYWLKNVIEGGN